MSGIPLSGTMNPKPLETSNHLMTPVNSMRVAAVSSTSSLTVPGRRFVPDIFDSIPSDAMTPHASALLAPLGGRFDESLWNRREHRPLNGKGAKCASAQLY